jgi:hypothetical protein
MIIDNKYLKVAQDGTLTFLYSLWKLPTVQRAFDGILQGDLSREQEKEIHNNIYDRRSDWLQYGPKPEAWDQFTEVTRIIGKKLLIQMWSSIMFQFEDEGPYPFEAFCSGVNLTLNEDGFLQCYMCLKDISCQQKPKGYNGCGCLKQTPDGMFLLNLGEVYKISILKTPEQGLVMKLTTEGVTIINGKPSNVGVQEEVEEG